VASASHAVPPTPCIFLDVTLTLHPVVSARDLDRFVDVPFQLYDQTRHPQWVPPLRASVRDVLHTKHPFWREAERAMWIAMRGGRAVGRIAAIENRVHNRFNDDRVGFFGFFECVDDAQVAGALFSAAADWLRARGLHSMLGPMNPGTNYECGLLVRGFENRPTFMTAWNPPFYDTLCTHAGLTKAKDLLAFWFSVEGVDYQPPEFVQRLVARAEERGRVTFRDVDMAHYARDVDLCWEMYNDAWERNWGFVPMSRDEFLHSAKDMKMLMRPELCFIAELDGRPAGFCLALPDYNEALYANRSGRLFPLGIARILRHRVRTPRTARVFALGVRKDARTRSVLALFAHELMRRGHAIGGSGAEASWLLEDNHLIVKPMRAMGATERMTWRLYERAL